MEYAILFLPLIGALIGYFGRTFTKYFAEISTSIFVSASAVLSVLVFGMEFKTIFTEII